MAMAAHALLRAADGKAQRDRAGAGVACLGRQAGEAVKAGIVSEAFPALTAGAAEDATARHLRPFDRRRRDRRRLTAG